MKVRRKLLVVAAVLIVAFLSMAGSCNIPGTDLYCYFDGDQFGCELD
jgi:hypothetical protein